CDSLRLHWNARPSTRMRGKNGTITHWSRCCLLREMKVILERFGQFGDRFSKHSFAVLLFRRLHRLSQRRNHFEQIADDSVVGHLKNWRVRILVDGDDALRALHADEG